MKSAELFRGGSGGLLTDDIGCVVTATGSMKIQVPTCFQHQHRFPGMAVVATIEKLPLNVLSPSMICMASPSFHPHSTLCNCLLFASLRYLTA